MSNNLDRLETVSVHSSVPLSVRSSMGTGASPVLLRYVYKPENPGSSKPVRVNRNEVMSISSNETERVPVSWNSYASYAPKMLSDYTDVTPSPRTKVNTWISQMRDPRSAGLVMNSNTVVPQKSAILARHDFKKTYSIQYSPTPTLRSLNSPLTSKESSEIRERYNVFQVTTTAARSYQSKDKYEIDNSTTTTPSTMSGKMLSPVVYLAPKKPINVYVNQPEVVEAKDDGAASEINGTEELVEEPQIDAEEELPESPAEEKSVEPEQKEEPPIVMPVPKRQLTLDEDLPSSPESQKKKELCSYLQLVKMSTASKKVGTPQKNRRSTRVKNHMLMTEKKELERKLHTELEKEFSATCNGSKSAKHPSQSNTSSEDNLIVGRENSDSENSRESSKKSFVELHIEDVYKQSINAWGTSQNNHQECSGKTDCRNSVKETLNLLKILPPVATDKIEHFDDTAKDYFHSEHIEFRETCDTKMMEKIPLKENNQLIKLKKKWSSKFKSKDNVKGKKLKGNLNAKFKNSNDKNRLHKMARMRKQKLRNNNDIRSLHISKTKLQKKKQYKKHFRYLPVVKRSLRSTKNLKSIVIKNILRENLKVQKQKKRPYKRKRNKRNEEPPVEPTCTEENTEKREVVHVLVDHDYINLQDTSDEARGDITNVQTLQDVELAHLTPECINSIIESQHFVLSNEFENVESTERAGKVSPIFSPCLGFGSTDATKESIEKINQICKKLDVDILFQNAVPVLNTEEITVEDDEISDVEEAAEDIHEDQTTLQLEEKDSCCSKENTPENIDALLTEEIQEPPAQNAEKKTEILDSSLISPRQWEYVALNREVKPKSLHRNLTQHKLRKKRLNLNGDYEADDSPAWETDESPNCSRQVNYEKRDLSHSIRIANEDGAVLKAYYVDFNLIIAQEFAVTFWSQSALGNVLGAQNMWIRKGQVNRLVLDNGCVQKDSAEMVISLENSVAYVELWTKEHKSEKRERPVADVFAAVYVCNQKQNGVFKKVLQLENIKGFANDVRYVVLTNSLNIVVSWSTIRDDEKVTIVHCYHLASDFQTVDAIKEVESVNHYVTSLHNIEGCDDLVMGWGERSVTLWNLEYGYVIATVEISETLPLISTLLVKCDRGFLFMIQRFVNGNLCLIAINGINQTWKRLQTFVAPRDYQKLLGISMENGILVAFYENGILCWSVQSGELRVEETSSEAVCIPSGKHVIMFTNEQVYVRHALAYLITNDES